MNGKPKFSTQPPEAKAAALAAGEGIIEEARHLATPDTKPWQLLDPNDKSRHQEIVRMNKVLHSKFMYVYENAKGRPSKNQILLDALEKHLNDEIQKIDAK